MARLIAAHHDHSHANYPPESIHSLDAGALAAPGVQLFAGRAGGVAVAMGALAPLGDGTGEIKSMHTSAAARGRGYARAMLDHLLAEARAAGMTALYLETGSGDPATAARALYHRAGFEDCPPFGPYRPDTMSVFMRRAV